MTRQDFLSVFGKKKKSQGPRSRKHVSVARRLVSTTLEIALQFQMYVLEQYHVVDKHVEILSLHVFYNNTS